MCNAGCTGATQTQASFSDTTITSAILSAKGSDDHSDGKSSLTTKAKQLDEQTQTNTAGTPFDCSDEEKSIKVREGG